MYDFDVCGFYFGNYVYWDVNKYIENVIECYGFEVSDVFFD